MSKILSIALNPAIDISSDADEVRHTHKTRTHNQRQHAGGGGINVARIIVELGGHCELLYLSGGATGELLETMLRPLGIRQHVMKIHDPVRVAYNVHELSTNLEYRFVPEGPLVSEAELAPVFDLLETTDADYVVASGSLPRGVPMDTYLRMAEIAQRKGQRFVLDTSGDALRETLASCHVFLVKPSLGELEGLVGRKLDHESVGPAAQEVIHRGAAQYIAVTLGADGAVLVSSDSITRVPAIKVTVQSAVGAGDSFVAGMTWSLSKGRDIVDAFRLGMAAGAAAVMTSGTELCRQKDILSLYDASKG
ncbi:1-phosphofructokinase family hexose kinase [Rhizobium sp. S95]|uniref:Phosphofructokinase n=1 Tax=Ciceribacter sichuanensis TaxID=2949647 RepID=A0AAJ1F9E1_9HYPH|nr:MULTISPECIES: 1-phosphofructokinase family hexose kinase [unclassified Ciceribacter]MCM2397970.1 1-phosphofructokinase family hexose kinase [Ciceribacter sp. S95]MCO5959224.1 1-phosphofructokinase family hexose kinase [Ciceribacter sp. S101]